VKKRLEIELFEENEIVNIYTVQFENESSEIDKFLDKFDPHGKYARDLQTIVKYLDQIGKRGALERYFRPEGRYADNVYALPIIKCKLRLYVIRISDNILILGNGGIKKTHKYEEDTELNSYVEQLQSIDRLIGIRIKQNLLHIHGKQVIGNLVFEIEL
jgi:hypothetical protein